MTLDRVLESEVLDTREIAVDYNSMDNTEANIAFVNDLIEAGFRGGDVIDVGTGTAKIPVLLAQRIEDCRIMAIDAATHMLTLARDNIEVASLIERIRLEHDDTKSLSFDDGIFDWVISNTVLHHIPEPSKMISEMVRVKNVDGTIFVRDLMRPESQEQIDDILFKHKDNMNASQRQILEDSLHAALSLDEIRELVTGFGFSDQSVQATSDRHWTWIFNRS